jgi:hypothetical protein
MVLVSLGLVVCAISAVLGFQFHACRMEDSGRPFPGSKLCLRNPQQVVAALALAVVTSATCGILMSYSTRFYTTEVNKRWVQALPAGEYTVSLGAGEAAIARIATYAWGATAVLLLAAFFGPLKWRSDTAPFLEEPPPRGRASGGPQQMAAQARNASPRGPAAFYLRQIVTLPVEAVPGRGDFKTEFGWPLQSAAYAAPPPALQLQGSSSFAFSTPLRRAQW